MRFDDGNESSNIEDRRGASGLSVGRGTIGVGTVVLALVAWYFGIDPSVVLNGAQVVQQRPAVEASSQPIDDPVEAPLVRYVSQVLGSTEKTWHEVFAQAGKTYVEPKMVLFREATPTACGTGQSAMGPFYCPLDQKVYIDLGFFEELRRRFKAPGNAAQAYVIAHEVGHHVQNLLGISEKVQQARSRLSESQGNALSVRLELQADCLAGVWANHANAEHHILEAGDVESVLGAASAIGDDTLQKNARGYVTPDSFTHGTSAQRMRWFKHGLETGRIAQCDTFKAE